MFNVKRVFLLNRTIIGIILSLVAIGLITLFSAANGSVYPWVFKQLPRFLVGSAVFVIIVAIDRRFWFAHAYSMYLVVLILLILVELTGLVGMGAQRWLDLYIFNLQPSELMRVTLILALARYFSAIDVGETRTFKGIVVPLALILVPVLLVMRQPDLGTAMLLICSGLAIFFVSGVSYWFFGIGFAGTVALIPLLWNLLHEYQRKRILIFLNPESDPSHAGYHVSQSKIALGSGGFLGKGWLKGTQSHLNFLPEKQTDFIFTMFAEEFGFLGSLGVIFLFALIIVWGYTVAEGAKTKFAKLVAMGITTMIFLYVFINVAMVMGMLPVVGVPLPFMSYGGTAMITLLFGMGLLCGASLPKN